MPTVRARLAFNNLIVLFAGMTLAGALMWVAAGRLYADTQRANLLAQAKLIAAGLQDAVLPTEPAQPYSQSSNVAPGIHTRILAESGAVVLGLPLTDEWIQMSQAEAFASIPPSELLQRPEIASALKGIPATATRNVTRSQRVIYAAAPIQNPNGGIAGIVYLAMPLPPGGLPADTLVQLLGAALIAILLAAAAGRTLARRIASPLESLADAAGAVSKGDLNPPVSSGTGIAELHSVERAFDEMTASLRRSDEMKKAFVADVAHELRTPLTVIKGTIETLEDGALDDLEGRAPLLSSMMRETDRLIRMVNELLVLTRADAGSLVLNRQAVDLAELAQMRCDNMGVVASRRGVELNVEREPHPFTISADPDRISQALDNLLANAIRHAPAHSAVTVSLRAKTGGVECSVRDSGGGIPARRLPFIFDRFYRVESSRDRTSGGAGLGLAIARALIEAHGGTIGAASEEGLGTTVSIYLPAKAPSD